MIYVITDGYENYKIGTTKNIKQRVNSLRTGNAAKLTVLFTFEGDSKTEKAIHKELKAYRKSGEWFSYRQNDDEKFDFKLGNFLKFLEMDGAKVLSLDTSELSNFRFDNLLAKRGVHVMNIRAIANVS